MSQDQLNKLSEQLATALSKIASMESELAPLRAQARSPQPQVDPRQIVQAMIQNPVGTMKQFGVPKEYQQHMTAALVSAEMQEMGIPVSGHVAARVEQFPTNQKIDAVTADVQALRQSIEADRNAQKQSANRESLKTLSTDKNKYPLLAAAMAKNPALFEGKVTAESDAATLAESLEKELAQYGEALGVKPQAQTASHEDAGNANTTTSTQVTAQPVEARAGNPPPLPKNGPTSSFTEADDYALRERITRKFQSGAYGKPTPQ